MAYQVRQHGERSTTALQLSQQPGFMKKKMNNIEYLYILYTCICLKYNVVLILTLTIQYIKKKGWG